MRYLYLDTSSSFLYAGIIEDNKLIDSICEEMASDLSKIALLKISNMFTNNNLKPTDIDKILVVNGPGSFTGIRVGITIAKTYAWGLKKDITTVTSLEAMAISSNFKGYKVPLIDARRGYVYASIFDENNNEIFKACHISLELLKEKINELGKDVVIITNDDIDLEYNKEEYKPDILKIVQNYKDRENVNPHLVNPEYLKLTEAEEKNNKND